MLMRTSRMSLQSHVGMHDNMTMRRDSPTHLHTYLHIFLSLFLAYELAEYIVSIS
jgi:hypothetical protein